MKFLEQVINYVNPIITKVNCPELIAGNMAGVNKSVANSGALSGYKVVVHYGATKKNEMTFNADDERLFVVYKSPKDAAIAYYQLMCQQMAKQKKRIATKNK